MGIFYYRCLDGFYGLPALTRAYIVFQSTTLSSWINYQVGAALREMTKEAD